MQNLLQPNDLFIFVNLEHANGLRLSLCAVLANSISRMFLRKHVAILQEVMRFDLHRRHRVFDAPQVREEVVPCHPLLVHGDDGISSVYVEDCRFELRFGAGEDGFNRRGKSFLARECIGGRHFCKVSVGYVKLLFWVRMKSGLEVS